MVNADGEGRLVVVAVMCHHLRQVQSFTEFTTHWHTDESFCQGSHQIYIFCRSELCSTDEVTLILAVRVIYNQYALSLS